MSSQSFGRLNTALHTTRCSGPRIGIVSGPNGTDCVLVAHRLVQRVVGEEQVDRGASPSAPDLSVARGHRAGQRGRVDTERSERGGDVVGVIGGDEDVHVDVDGGARLGVVGERERAAECVGDADPCASAWCSATTLSGSDGSVTAGVAAPARSVGEQQQVAQRLAPLDRGRATPRRRRAHGVGHAGVGLDRLGERRRQRGRRLVPGADLGEQRAGGGVGGRRAHGDGGTGTRARRGRRSWTSTGTSARSMHVGDAPSSSRVGEGGEGAGPRARRGVTRDSRTSKRPPGRSTTNAIVGTLPTMPAIYQELATRARATRARRCRCRCPRRC